VLELRAGQRFARATFASFVRQTLRPGHFCQLDAYQENSACRVNATVLDAIQALRTTGARRRMHDVCATARDWRDLMRIKERNRHRSNNAAMNAIASLPPSRMKR
jgi:hypothetical protein